jgi:hypothetical protein
VAAPVARGVDERDVAPGPVAQPQPAAATAVDHVPKPGRGQRSHPRREAGHDGRVVEVVRLARAVADQPGAAVGFHEQRVREPRLVGIGGGREDLAQACRPRPQRGHVRRRSDGLVHLTAVQLRGKRGPVRRGVVDQPDGDVRARRRVSVELHKAITAD